MMNALVIALVITVLATGGPRGPSGGRMELGLGPLASAFTEEDRVALRSEFLSEPGYFRQMRQRRRENIRGLAAALRADPFEPAALQPLLEDERAFLAEVQTRGQSILIDRIVQMAPEERDALADRLVERRFPRP
ncbi:periplasmic heavy metal sensor [Aestuariibius sp. 2305UL40-4]|uniref:periplasmic heavy metal sensor n=1 Tax=Aestuariibius violaceus TaxID=3234132 RepID=UPI00345F07D3